MSDSEDVDEADEEEDQEEEEEEDLCDEEAQSDAEMEEPEDRDLCYDVRLLTAPRVSGQHSSDTDYSTPLSHIWDIGVE